MSKWIGFGVAVGITCALVPVVQGSISLERPLGPLAKLAPKSIQKLAEPEKSSRPSFDGLDLSRMTLRPDRTLVPLKDGKIAKLTIDPVVQRTVMGVMRRYRVPEAGVVMLDVKTGNVVAYASYVTDGKPFDVNARALAPAASVFKLVTSSALIERAGLNSQTKQCYHGGRSRIDASELRDDPKKDKWCATLASALGRSLNVVFARLAQRHLTPEDETAMAGAFGFGAPIPFELPNQAPSVEMPADPLEFARAAAGFWHTTLSPLAAASLAQTIANGGVALEPRIVQAVIKGKETLWQADSTPRVLRRAIKGSTAKELTIMMKETVANGTAFSSFHDRKRQPYLPRIEVAGKTGTLTDYKANKFFTWFVGFAPADDPQIAVAALAVNTPTWRIKGPHLARDALRAYFSHKNWRGVTNPL